MEAYVRHCLRVRNVSWFPIGVSGKGEAVYDSTEKEHDDDNAARGVAGAATDRATTARLPDSHTHLHSDDVYTDMGDSDGEDSNLAADEDPTALAEAVATLQKQLNKLTAAAVSGSSHVAAAALPAPAAAVPADGGGAGLLLPPDKWAEPVLGAQAQAVLRQSLLEAGQLVELAEQHIAAHLALEKKKQ